MAGSVNRAILLGNLGSDPEIADLGENRIACRLSLATNREWKDRQTGERKGQVQWHRIVIFDQNKAAFAKNFLRKGDRLYLEGRIRTRNWSDSSGQQRWFTEIVLSGPNCVLTALPKSSATPGKSRLDRQIQTDDIVWNSKGIVLPEDSIQDVPF